MKLNSSLSKFNIVLFLVGFIIVIATLDFVRNTQVEDITIGQDIDALSPNSIPSKAQQGDNPIVQYAAEETECYEITFLSNTCPCDNVVCGPNQTCIAGVCEVNSSLTYGDCTADNDTTSILGVCNQTLNITPTFNMTLTANNRIITTNNIPNHQVGLFGMVPGRLNPNAISAQNNSYTITLTPTLTGNVTQLLNTVGLPGVPPGPKYSFGIILNGIEVDPVAAEPFPHLGTMDPNATWEWNLEALGLAINLGLDCNYAHVQATGKYHYHGIPTLYLQNANIPKNAMTLIGYAADGFPIYYKYGYENATDASTNIIEMKSSFRLKQCDRPGDGTTAPCGQYDGTYSNDWGYYESSGTLDECNGRTGVTPEYPSGTYYYVITEDFPAIPRCFKGTPSNDFSI